MKTRSVLSKIFKNCSNYQNLPWLITIATANAKALLIECVVTV